MKIDIWLDWTSWTIGFEFVRLRFGWWSWITYCNLLVLKIDVTIK